MSVRFRGSSGSPIARHSDGRLTPLWRRGGEEKPGVVSSPVNLAELLFAVTSTLLFFDGLWLG
jgi:hypothetical protein